MTRALLLTVFAAACHEAYVPPPVVDLEAPETGTYFVGDSLHLVFDVPVDPETVGVRVWADQRDIEGELPDDAAPLLGTCTAASSPCGETTLTVDDDRLGATLTFDPEGLGKPDVPLLLEVVPGVRDADSGARTGRAFLFDFQFKPVEASEEAVEFEQGVYIVVGQTTMPVPATLSLITDFRATPNGQVAMVGAEADEVQGVPKNTTDATKLFVDTSDQGYALFMRAQVRRTEADERFFESEPTEVNLKLGPITITIQGTRLTGKVIKDAAGHDRLEGTLSFDDILMDSGTGRPPYPFGAGSTTFEAVYVPDDIVPDGAPRVCGDQCGAVTTQCLPPADFPGDGFCP